MFLYLDTADDVCPRFHSETARESNKASHVVCGRFLKHVLHPKNGTRSRRLYDDPSLTKRYTLLNSMFFLDFELVIYEILKFLFRVLAGPQDQEKTKLFIDRHFKSYTVSLNSF